ncbi:MAG: YkgJ family cysteine cluster protein [Gammaproteobacteria bacterium]|nr:YkgJ family cysteine cluster protein [Gammaproteobacteria bacterium]
MPRNQKRCSHKRSIQNALALYQKQVIIPHCRDCQRPCCRLTDVVLEFSWQHLSAMYQLGHDKKAFDNSLRNGTGPTYIRKQNDTYYTHGSPCPAYDTTSGQCQVYRKNIKPDNCSDFPLYMDGKMIVVDKRCEAANDTELLGQLEKLFNKLSFTRHPDTQFPFLIYIDFTLQKPGSDTSKH